MTETGPLVVDAPWLRPRYLEAEHSGYVERLMLALEDKSPHAPLNIALAGAYGSGKSSVLDGLAEKLGDTEILNISLPLFTLPKSKDKSDATATINEVQKEIVKQLLYHETPERLVQSRFKRIVKPNRWRFAAIAALAALVVVAILFATGASSRFEAALAWAPFPLISLGWQVLYLMTFALLFCALVLAEGRFRVSDVKAGPATIRVGDSIDSTFDKNLDEIVYFFSVTSYSTVVFEDLDRFERIGILEEIRELNLLLNRAKQIGRPIRFVYALRDSIFESKDADGVAAGIQRAKFFDLVIPIVPFATQRTAVDLWIKEMKLAGLMLSAATARVAANYIQDMRVIRTVRNEYSVYQSELEKNQLDAVDPLVLFGLMLYKAVHLSDFEKIRVGASELDAIERQRQNIASSNRKHFQARLREIDSGSAHADALQARARSFARALRQAIELSFRLAKRALGEVTYTIDSDSFDARGAERPSFWRQLQRSAEELTFTSGGGVVSVVTTEDLTRILGLDPSAVSWEEERADDGQRDEVRLHLDQIDSMEIAELATHEWVILPDGAGSFDDALALVSKSALARRLFLEGMLDRNFSLYVSRFYGGVVSIAAMNFVLHVVQPSLVQITAPLPSRSDVDGVLGEAGAGMLETRSALNIDLVDHLVADELLEPVLARIVDGSDDSQDFLTAYVISGRHTPQMYRRLVPLWPGALKYAVGLAETDEALALQLVEICLDATPKGSSLQATDANVADFLAAHAADISLFANGASKPKRLASQLAALGVRFPDLSALEESVRSEVARRGLFDINESNLRTALGKAVNWSLDAVLVNAPDIFARLLGGVEDYLRVLPRVVPTIANSDAVSHVLTEAYESVAEDHLAVILERAGRGVRVQDIRQIPRGCWRAVLAAGRLEDYAVNLLRYFDDLGADASFDRVVSANPSAREWKQLTPDDRRRLAIAVVTRDAIAPLKRARFARSLVLDQPLEVTDLDDTTGEVFSYLAKFGTLEDSLTTFDALSGRGWTTRSAFMKRAPDFASYISEAKFDRDEILLVFRNPSVSPATRQVFILALASLQNQLTPTSATVIANYIVSRRDVRLSIGGMEALAAAGCQGLALAPILTRWKLTDQQLVGILALARKPWRELAATGTSKPKIPIGPGVPELLSRLKAIGTVSSWREEKQSYRVYLRR